MLKKHLMLMALVSGLAVATASAQGYQPQQKKEMTFSGTVESVNLKDHTFLVRNHENKNKVEEMRFQFPASGVNFVLEGETVPIDELQRGDEVTVTWEPENVMHMVKNVHRHHGEMAEHTMMKAGDPFTFTGKVESVDMKDQSFVVRNESQGKVEELRFHLAPGTELILDGSPVILSELQANDTVTVNYETIPTLKSVHKKAT